MRTLLLIPVVLLLAGCGTEQSSFEGSDEALKDAGSSRVEYRTTGAGPSFTGAGAIDYAHDRGELVMSSMEMGIPGGEMEFRFIGATTYVGFTLLGKLRWEKETEDALTGTDRFVPGPGGPSPDQLLDMLTDASERVETLGSEEIRGVSTTHYGAHLNRKKLGEDARGLAEEVVVEAWIDDDGLLRRLRVPDDGLILTVELFDFGVGVEVEAPPDEDVVSEERLYSLMEEECEQMPPEKRRKSFFCEVPTLESGGEYGETEPVPEEADD